MQWGHRCLACSYSSAPQYSIFKPQGIVRAVTRRRLLPHTSLDHLKTSPNSRKKVSRGPCRVCQCTEFSHLPRMPRIILWSLSITIPWLQTDGFPDSSLAKGCYVKVQLPAPTVTSERDSSIWRRNLLEIQWFPILILDLQYEFSEVIPSSIFAESNQICAFWPKD